MSFTDSGYRNEYEVTLFVDTKPRRHSFRGVSVVSFDSVINYLDKSCKIIIATKLSEYLELRAKLFQHQYYEFEDFYYYESLHKKISIFYGNCQMGDLNYYMSQIPEFMEEYWIYPFPQACDIAAEYYPPAIFQHCDLFIYQEVKKESNGILFSTDYMREHLRKDTTVVRIPNLYQMGFGFFPQSASKRLEAMREAEILFVENKDGHDKIITQLYRQGKSAEEIIKAIKYEQLFDEKTIQDTFDFYMEKLKKQDEENTIKIYDFIKKSYKKIRIFTDPGHVTNCIYEQYLIQLLAILQINTKVSLSEILLRKEHSASMLIYPCVGKVLGLEYSSAKQTLKEYGFRLTSGCLDIEEYVKQYIFMCVDSSRIE